MKTKLVQYGSVVAANFAMLMSLYVVVSVFLVLFVSISAPFNEHQIWQSSISGIDNNGRQLSQAAELAQTVRTQVVLLLTAVVIASTIILTLSYSLLSYLLLSGLPSLANIVRRSTAILLILLASVLIVQLTNPAQLFFVVGICSILVYYAINILLIPNHGPLIKSIVDTITNRPYLSILGLGAILAIALISLGLAMAIGIVSHAAYAVTVALVVVSLAQALWQTRITQEHTGGKRK